MLTRARTAGLHYCWCQQHRNTHTRHALWWDTTDTSSHPRPPSDALAVRSGPGENTSRPRARWPKDTNAEAARCDGKRTRRERCPGKQNERSSHAFEDARASAGRPTGEEDANRAMCVWREAAKESWGGGGADQLCLELDRDEDSVGLRQAGPGILRRGEHPGDQTLSVGLQSRATVTHDGVAAQELATRAAVLRTAHVSAPVARAHPSDLTVKRKAPAGNVFEFSELMNTQVKQTQFPINWPINLQVGSLNTGVAGRAAHQHPRRAQCAAQLGLGRQQAAAGSVEAVRVEQRAGLRLGVEG